MIIPPLRTQGSKPAVLVTGTRASGKSAFKTLLQAQLPARVHRYHHGRDNTDIEGDDEYNSIIECKHDLVETWIQRHPSRHVICLYLLQPNDYPLLRPPRPALEPLSRLLDLAVISQKADSARLIVLPVLSKADSYTIQSLQANKLATAALLTVADYREGEGLWSVISPDWDNAPVAGGLEKLAAVCASLSPYSSSGEETRVDTDDSLVRHYPWGSCHVLNPAHSNTNNVVDWVVEKYVELQKIEIFSSSSDLLSEECPTSVTAPSLKLPAPPRPTLEIAVPKAEAMPEATPAQEPVEMTIEGAEEELDDQDRDDVESVDSSVTCAHSPCQLYDCNGMHGEYQQLKLNYKTDVTRGTVFSKPLPPPPIKTTLNPDDLPNGPPPAPLLSPSGRRWPGAPASTTGLPDDGYPNSHPRQTFLEELEMERGEWRRRRNNAPPQTPSEQAPPPEAEPTVPKVEDNFIRSIPSSVRPIAPRASNPSEDDNERFDRHSISHEQQQASPPSSFPIQIVAISPHNEHHPSVSSRPGSPSGLGAAAAGANGAGSSFVIPKKPRKAKSQFACSFCRSRKLKCAPSSSATGRSCAECEKRGYECEMPAHNPNPAPTATPDMKKGREASHRNSIDIMISETLDRPPAGAAAALPLSASSHPPPPHQYDHQPIAVLRPIPHHHRTSIASTPAARDTTANNNNAVSINPDMVPPSVTYSGAPLQILHRPRQYNKEHHHHQDYRHHHHQSSSRTAVTAVDPWMERHPYRRGESSPSPPPPLPRSSSSTSLSSSFSQQQQQLQHLPPAPPLQLQSHYEHALPRPPQAVPSQNHRPPRPLSPQYQHRHQHSRSLSREHPHRSPSSAHASVPSSHRRTHSSSSSSHHQHIMEPQLQQPPQPRSGEVFQSHLPPMPPPPQSGQFAYSPTTPNSTLSNSPLPPPPQAKKPRLNSVVTGRTSYAKGSSRSGPKVVACNYCRARKTRCDGGTPCSNCQKRHLDCEYVIFPRESARRKSLRAAAAAAGQEFDESKALDQSHVPLPDRPIGRPRTVPRGLPPIDPGDEGPPSSLPLHQPYGRPANNPSSTIPSPYAPVPSSNTFSPRLPPIASLVSPPSHPATIASSSPAEVTPPPPPSNLPPIQTTNLKRPLSSHGGGGGGNESATSERPIQSKRMRVDELVSRTSRSPPPPSAHPDRNIW